MGTKLALACCSVGTLLAAGQAAAQLLPGERPADIAAIPGVVAASAEWERVWADFVVADGMVGTDDGGLLFAVEQTDAIVKLDANMNEYTYLANTRGAGSASVDAQGRLYVVQRTCTEPLNDDLGGCKELTNVSMLAPERRLLANSFADGSPLGRLNDLIADGKGGAYFTVGGAYYVDPDGVVSTVADQDIRSNGIMLSRDGRTLYVTNRTVVLAFDVARDGSASNRRDFGSLNGDDGGDGMAIDSEGRLYVTANAGVHVLAADGRYLGLIPTHRRPITIAFSGPEKKTLFVSGIGVVGPDGKPWTAPEGVRTTATTIYALPMLSQGFAGRPK